MKDPPSVGPCKLPHKTQSKLKNMYSYSAKKKKFIIAYWLTLKNKKKTLAGTTFRVVS